MFSYSLILEEEWNEAEPLFFPSFLLSAIGSIEIIQDIEMIITIHPEQQQCKVDGLLICLILEENRNPSEPEPLLFLPSYIPLHKIDAKSPVSQKTIITMHAQQQRC